MAFKVDTMPFKLQLKLTNYAESLEEKPHYHVKRISFVVTILRDGCSPADANTHSQPFSVDDQEELNWHATPPYQDDLELRSDLTTLSGKLCPCKKISTSLFDFVTDEDTHQQRAEIVPLSSYRHASYRTSMLTRHSAGPDGQIELLYSHDGLEEDQSGLRWRSHDYMKLEIPEPKPYYRVFWLIQWDIVDLLDLRLGQEALHGRRLRSTRFQGIRYCANRKKPYIAEMRPPKSRGKLWLGSYGTEEAAARAVDAAYYYYYQGHRLNFRDSPQFLKPIPLDLSGKAKEAFVKFAARRLASIQSPWIRDTNMSPRTSTGRNLGGVAYSSQPSHTARFPQSVGFISPQSWDHIASDNVERAANTNYARILESTSANIDVDDSVANQPSTSYGSLWLSSLSSLSSPNGCFGGQPFNSYGSLWLSPLTGSSPGHRNEGALYPPCLTSDLENFSSPEATTSVVNVIASNSSGGGPLWGENLIAEFASLEGPTDSYIASVEASDLNDANEMERNTRSWASHRSYDLDQATESVQAEPEGDHMGHIDPLEWLLSSNIEDL